MRAWTHIHIKNQRACGYAHPQGQYACYFVAGANRLVRRLRSDRRRTSRSFLAAKQYLRSCPRCLPRPECSFVIVSWNTRHTPAESIPALLRVVSLQDNNHEIIIVDSGSIDGAENSCASAFRRLSSCTAMRISTSGQGTGLVSHPHDLKTLLSGASFLDLIDSSQI
jgi:hypothetical protein